MKKIVTLFTTLCIVFSMFGIFTVFAEDSDPTQEWVKISTLEELESFRNKVNNGDVSKWKQLIGELTADIDMSEKYGIGKELWTSIGTEEHPFEGIFDGNGHTVNVSIESETGGLFGYTTVNSKIENLNTVGSMTVRGTIHFGIPSSSSLRHIGVIAGYNIGSIDDCFNSADLNYTGNYAAVGGIAGTAVNGVTNCCNIGKITIMNTSKGNNIASTERTDLMKNCFYLAEEGEQDEYGAQGKTVGQFASGEVTYMLNGCTSDEDMVWWYQNIGSDPFPVLDKTHSIVYMKYYNNEPVPYNVKYYEGRPISAKDFLPEDNLKLDYDIIASQDELNKKCGNNPLLVNSYSEGIFSNNSALLIVSWQECQQARTHKIAAVKYSENDGYNITLSRCIAENESSPDVMTDYCAVIIIPQNTTAANVRIITEEEKTYPYEITGLRLTDAGGNEMIAPEQGKSFIVETDIVKTEERNEKDYLFVAVYDESGVLLSIDYVKAKFAVDGECSFGFNIPAQTKQVGSVKAFVWNTFNSMEPLAKTEILTFTE